MASRGSSDEGRKAPRRGRPTITYTDFETFVKHRPMILAENAELFADFIGGMITFPRIEGGETRADDILEAQGSVELRSAVTSRRLTQSEIVEVLESADFETLVQKDGFCASTIWCHGSWRVMTSRS